MLGSLLLNSCGLGPRINDITTSEVAPQFIELASRNPDRDYSYPSEYYTQQVSFYKDLKALGPISMERQKLLSLAEKAALSMPAWQLVSVDAKAGRIEGTATTSLLKFKDDFVIELRPIETRSESPSNSDGEAQASTWMIHMRSKSRLGQHDFGANAKRIEAFMEALQKQL